MHILLETNEAVRKEKLILSDLINDIIIRYETPVDNIYDDRTARKLNRVREKLQQEETTWKTKKLEQRMDHVERTGPKGQTPIKLHWWS